MAAAAARLAAECASAPSGPVIRRLKTSCTCVLPTELGDTASRSLRPFGVLDRAEADSRGVETGRTGAAAGSKSRDLSEAETRKDCRRRGVVDCEWCSSRWVRRESTKEARSPIRLRRSCCDATDSSSLGPPSRSKMPSILGRGGGPVASVSRGELSRKFGTT